MTVLSMHLMWRHRQAEWTDAQWLEQYENSRFGNSQHGIAWAGRRNRKASSWLARFRGFQLWLGGFAIFGRPPVTVLVLTAFWPTLLG